MIASNQNSNELTSKIISSQDDNYIPIFYRPENPSEKEQLNELINTKENLIIHNEMVGQLEELVKSQNPKEKFTPEKFKRKIIEHLDGTPIDDYGVWVYYPWSNRLVHLLDREEFIEVRTNRNHYKITPEEEEILQQKVLGVIGLSVGKAIALTIAMERICGELRLTDFDVIELSNLNRIQTGVKNFGTKKTIVVAREIAEIDPYIKITCYSEGLTEENIDDFYLKGGKMDMCIEVCDGLYTKIYARQKAKKLGIPVVMNSSDRGVTDVERFDLEPDRSILHGLIDHLDLSLVKQAKTNEEKVPYLLPMLGLETCSTRIKSSMLEIEQSITTWPQLASAVAMGGAICTDVCRRILLGQHTSSGRFIMDVEDIIPDEDHGKDQEIPLQINQPLSNDDMLNEINKENSEPWDFQVDPGEKTITQIVEAGAKAPSGANGQSWKWVYKNKTLYLFFDDVFRPKLLDCKRTTSIVGLGAATENIVLKAHQLGYEIIAETASIDDQSKLITTYRFFDKAHDIYKDKFEAHVCDNLVDTIDHRVTNRNILLESEPIESNHLESLRKVAQTIPGADLLIIDDPVKLKKLAELTGKLDRIRYTSESGHYDFRAEARWTAEDAEQTRNGVYFKEAVDLTPTEYMGFYISRNWPIIKHLSDWKLGTGFEKIQKKWINGSAAVGLVTVPDFGTNNFFDGGRALERVWLTANKNGIATHPPSISTLIFNSIVYDENEVLPEDMKKEALQLMEEFENLFNIDSHKGKVLLLRFFIGDPPKFRPLKYKTNEILKFL